MSFNNYRSDSFIHSLYKKVDELTYKIVSVTRQVNDVQQFLKDEGITLPEGSGGNSAPDYSAEMVVLQQFVNNIPVPDTYITISLTEFISRALKAYNIITNYQPNLEHLPILPHLGYETLTWPDAIETVKKIPVFFLPNTLETMFYNLNSLMTGTGGGSGSSSSGCSSGVDYDAEITALQIVAAKIPTAFTINTLSIIKEDVRVHNTKFTFIPSNNTFNPEAWSTVVKAVDKIPSDFESTTLQQLYDDVSILKNNMPNQDLFNVSSWETVFIAANMIPSSFNSNTLQQMYQNVNSLMNGGSGSGENGTGSNTDYGKDLEALQQAVETLQSAIPSTFTSSTWNNARANISEILSRIINLPYLPNLPEETYTWVKLVNAGKKVPVDFTVDTLETMYNDVENIKTAVNIIPELQQTVSNMISQLNAQSLIDLNTLQTALDEADGSLQTIADRLQQMQ